MVRTRMRVVVSVARIAFVAVAPSIPGMDRSMITTSGCRRCASATASAPFDASPTTAMSRAGLSTARNPARTTAWSSASTTRITSPGMVVFLIEGCTTTDRWRCGCRRERNPDAHRGALFAARDDVERAVEQPDSLAHGEQPHRRTTSLGHVDVETGTVVLNLHADGPP